MLAFCGSSFELFVDLSSEVVASELLRASSQMLRDVVRAFSLRSCEMATANQPVAAEIERRKKCSHGVGIGYFF